MPLPTAFQLLQTIDPISAVQPYISLNERLGTERPTTVREREAVPYSFKEMRERERSRGRTMELGGWDVRKRKAERKGEKI